MSEKRALEIIAIWEADDDPAANARARHERKLLARTPEEWAEADKRNAIRRALTIKHRRSDVMRAVECVVCGTPFFDEQTTSDIKYDHANRHRWVRSKRCPESPRELQKDGQEWYERKTIRRDKLTCSARCRQRKRRAELKQGQDANVGAIS